MRIGRVLMAACVAATACAAGCVSQLEHDAMARANLQMQDRLNTCQAEQVKARTQVAVLRQDVLRARQDQQETQDRLDGTKRDMAVLQTRIDVQTEIIDRARKQAPQSQSAVSLSSETLDKLIQRVEALTKENSRLQADVNRLQSQLKQQEAARDIAALNEQAGKSRTVNPTPAATNNRANPPTR